jgi:hypothetical protein
LKNVKIFSNFLKSRFLLRIGARDFAEVLRAEIFEATECTASVGLGPSLLLARLATRKAKPNGTFFLSADDAEEFMKTVSVQELPGELVSSIRAWVYQTGEEIALKVDVLGECL